MANEPKPSSPYRFRSLPVQGIVFLTEFFRYRAEPEREVLQVLLYKERFYLRKCRAFENLLHDAL